MLDDFKSLLGDSNKPKKIAMFDDSEMGKNRELATQLFESDIVLTVKQMQGILSARGGRLRRAKRKVITGMVNRWKPSSIPYRFKDNDD
ncbi:hypothetical protein PMAYCL1PPCAC_25157, partial [Pristionchus mayeri]